MADQVDDGLVVDERSRLPVLADVREQAVLDGATSSYQELKELLVQNGTTSDETATVQLDAQGNVESIAVTFGTQAGIAVSPGTA